MMRSVRGVLCAWACLIVIGPYAAAQTIEAGLLKAMRSSELILTPPADSALVELPEQSTTGPVPPPGVAPKSVLPAFAETGAVKTLSVPGYAWRYGCGPTSVGMVLGYYDLQGYELLAGSAAVQTEDVNQGIASQGAAGSPGHYEDYSLPLDSGTSSILADRSQQPVENRHPSNSIADFMRTSWSSIGNRYGWSYSNDIGPAFVGYVNWRNPNYMPRAQYYSMGSGALTWSVLTQEIDSGRPMVFLVDSSGDGWTDHFVAVVGYRESPTRQYGCLDTWNPPDVVRWCEFRGMSSSYGWGVSSGWSFALRTVVIAGRVQAADGTGLAGVIMNGLPGPPATDNTGHYSVSVPYGWSGTVTPTWSDWRFVPVDRSYGGLTSDQPNEDYMREPLLAGDVNGDAQVNATDLQAVVAAWTSCAGPPASSTWNPAADCNGDGHVNVGDLQVLLANWGETAW